MKGLMLFAAAALYAGVPQNGSPQAFRASTDAVALDVAVFDGDRVVSSLGASDFELYDNGVRQTVSAVDFNALPIDLRLVFDTSGSITDADLDVYLRAMRRVVGALQPEDRCEIMTFGTRIADAASRQRPPVTVTLRRIQQEGTAFFDAVMLAMITAPALDRRRITIVLSDASDNSSFFDESTFVDAARRTDAVVYTILPAQIAADQWPPAARLRALSLLTGGRLVSSSKDAQLGRTINDAIDEFRQSYVLRYTVNGVQVTGWHKLTVKVRGADRYTVRAREGYFGR
jgi:VWFA-related protein